ncbi:MAG: NAD-dependent epimerase/dehydratase family protein [Carboxydocellales bacterium]
MRVLITGSTGFLGQHMINYLQTRKTAHEILAVGQSGCNLLNTGEIKDLLKGFNPELVFHFAGRLTGEFAQLFLVNAIGTLNLLEQIYRLCPDTRVVIAGSAAEYGFAPHTTLYSETLPPHPVSDYGRAKLAQTLIAQTFVQKGLPITVARIFNIVGPELAEHLVVPSFINRVINLEINPQQPRVIKVGNIELERDFISIGTLVRLLWFLGVCPYREFIVNAGSGEPTKISALLTELKQLSPVDFDYVIDPALLRPHDQSVICDTAKLKSLGWKHPNEVSRIRTAIHNMFGHLRKKRGADYEPGKNIGHYSCS